MSKNFFLVSLGMGILSILSGCSKDDINIVKKEKVDLSTVPSPSLPAETLLPIKMSAGYKHSIIINSVGNLYGWGSSEEGELCEKNSKVAPKVINQDNWKSISVGYESSIGIKNDGTLWATGYNNMGQLGIGSVENAEEFTQIGKDNDWEKVNIGYRHSLALKKDGTIWVWGSNEFGQFGDGTDAPSDRPKKVGTDTDWIDIAAGHNQCFAIKKDGSLWAWGYNFYGQLGLDYSNKVLIPTKIKSDKKWKSIVTGISFTGAIAEDGSLWMWGRNYHGELGIGTGNLTTNNTDTPTKVSSDIPWKKISLGNGHVLALKTDNTLWAWGRNDNGQLGLGEEVTSKSYKNVPTKVNNDTDWEDISAGEFFSIAKKKDNTYWGFGSNKYGQISTEKKKKKKKKKK